MNNIIDLSKYDYVIGYGLGEHYERIKNEIFHKVKFHYLCDQKLDGAKINIYDGIPIISREKIKELKKVLLVLMIEKGYLVSEIKKKFGI